MKNSNKNFYKYITLGILGMLGSSGTIFVDTFFVSNRLGADGLTALNIAIAIFGVMSGLGLMLGVGGATLYSIYRAQNNSKRANEVFSLAFITAFIFSVVLFMLGLFAARPISIMLGAKDIILTMCESYIKTVLSFSPFFIINYLMMSFIRNDNNPKLAMVMMIAGSLSNVILDFVFLYPLNMGIFGAALATGFSPIISLLIGVFHFISHKNKFHLIKIRYNLKELIIIIKPGIATLINELSSSMVLIVFNLLILHIAGNIGVAAYGIVANLALIVVAIFNGLTQGLQPLLSEAYGLDDKATLKKLFKKGLIIIFILGLSFHLVSIILTNQLVTIFNSDHNQALQVLAEEGLVTYFVGFIFAGLNYLIISYFSVTNRTMAALFLSIFRGLLGIILIAVCLGNILGLFGIWLTYPLVEFITLTSGFICYQKELKLDTQLVIANKKGETF